MTPSTSTLNLTDAGDSTEDQDKLAQKKIQASTPSSPSRRTTKDEYSNGSVRHSTHVKSNHTKAAVIGARAAVTEWWGLMDTFLGELSSDNMRASCVLCSLCTMRTMRRARST